MAFSPTLIRRTLANRSVSVRVTPPPVNFAERRSILQVLEQHGVVDYFKSVPGHDSIYISLMKDEEAVSKLVTRSPLSYDVSVPGNIKETYLADLTKPQKFASQRPVTNIIEKSDPEGDGIRQDQDTDTKKFTLHVWPAPEYRHDSAATTSPLHKSWPDFLLDDQSFLVETLKQSLPDGLAARGLAHWSPDLGKTRAPSTDRTKRNERLHLVDWTPSKLRHRAELRDARKQQPENNTPEPTVLGVNEKDDGSC